MRTEEWSTVGTDQATGFHLRVIRLQRCAHEGTIIYSEQLRITTSDPAYPKLHISLVLEAR